MIVSQSRDSKLPYTTCTSQSTTYSFRTFAVLSTVHLDPVFNHYSPRRTVFCGHAQNTFQPSHGLLSFSSCPKDWILGLSSLRLTSELLTKSRHLGPILRRQRCSNTESLLAHCALKGHVSNTHGNTNLIGAAYFRRLIDNRNSCECHRCFELAIVNRAFCLREDTSSDVRPLGEMQLVIVCSKQMVGYRATIKEVASPGLRLHSTYN